MSTPMPSERLAGIAARVDAATAGPWGFYDGDTYADVAADMEQTGPGSYSYRQKIAQLDDDHYWDDTAHEDDDEECAAAQMTADARFIAHARTDLPDLLAEVERLRTEVESLRRCASEQLETIQEAAAVLAERGDELRSLRGELAARLTRAEVLRGAADHLSESCPDHSDAEEVWMDCPCEWADALHSLADESDPAEVGGDGRG